MNDDDRVRRENAAHAQEVLAEAERRDANARSAVAAVEGFRTLLRTQPCKRREIGKVIEIAEAVIAARLGTSEAGRDVLQLVDDIRESLTRAGLSSHDVNPALARSVLLNGLVKLQLIERELDVTKVV